MRPLGFLVLLPLLSLTAGPLSAAENEFGPFDQPAVVVESFAGTVSVDIGDGPGIRATLDGDESALEDISVAERDGAVSIIGPQTGKNSSATVVGNATVIVSGGGKAEVTIGNVTSVTGGVDDEAVTLRLTVPKGTALTFDRFAGDATIADTDAPLAVALLSGTVDAGAVSEASLAINGSGNIRLRHAYSALVMNINGAGTIDVGGGDVTDLTGRINGSGTLRFNGRAETAEVSINGAGTIELSHVDARPRTHLAGAGQISVGNW